MSARARRATSMAIVHPPIWQTEGDGAPALSRPSRPNAAPPARGARGAGDELPLADVERDAFAKGFAQGERAGAEAAAVQGEAMLRRLMQTLEEVTDLRERMIRDTEHQMVRLALAIARRVVHREVSLDRDLIMAIARVAMDRIGDGATVTIRLNADDYAAISTAGQTPWTGGHVTVQADARVPRGGCRIESDLGLIDAGVDAQLQEITRALLHDAPAATNATQR